MDTKALRQKVLDLAIRGKLVPQDPNDEPASVLLERIRQQKQQMVKDGKLKAKDIKNDTIIFVGEDNLHYEKFADGSVKCIEDEIPFDLPDGWSWCHYSDVIELYSGQDLTPDRYNDVGNGIPYIIGASNLEHGKVIINRWTATVPAPEPDSCHWVWQAAGCLPEGSSICRCIQKRRFGCLSGQSILAAGTSP